MNRIRFIGAAALSLIGAGAAPAFAQTEIVAQANPDADRLAGDMRVLAGDPRDLSALLDAGMISARLGDTSAALAFFQRAEAVDPANPRIAAGRAMALVRLERPGEALRLFQSAEARGLPMAPYAADRGFAYDLLGQPLLAQREYRLALSSGDGEDETVRRYALSLGITGDGAEAMKLLDPLLRRSDRAAWRARAFILAMGGDVTGAEKIAASMMPGNMGQALTPFFRRLGGLGPADRAFAVHFGELSPTQARLADARMAPELPRYVPAPRPVQVAAAAAPPAAAPAPARTGRDRRSRREREEDERKATAAAIEAARRQPPPAPAEAPLPAPPQFVQRSEPIVQPIPAPSREQEPAEVANRAPAPARTVASAPAAASAQGGPAFRSVPSAAVPASPPVEVVRSEPGPAVEVTRSEPVPPGPARVGKEDSVLASIVGGITIPAEELEVVNAPPADAPAPAPAPAEPVRVAEARPVPVAPKAAPPKPAPAKPVPAKPDAKKADAAKPDPKKKTDTAKADPKAKKPDPKKPDPAKAEPKRIWVQVAGGANEDALAKAWKGVVAKAPAAMKGKSAWWTPLRATNRVLAGPFKTAAEAQSFVNTLGKAGISAFVFTSEPGQKVNRLAL